MRGEFFVYPYSKGWTAKKMRKIPLGKPRGKLLNYAFNSINYLVMVTVLPSAEISTL